MGSNIDEDFRNRVLNKNVTFKTIEEFKQYYDSPCIMVGIKGQTKEMIEHDIEILEQYFNHATISVYRNNWTPIKRDDELVEWFMNKYDY